MTFNTASQSIFAANQVDRDCAEKLQGGGKLAGVMVSSSKFTADTLEGRTALRRDPDRMDK